MTTTTTLCLLATTAVSAFAPAVASASSVTALHTFTGLDGFPTGSLIPFNGLLYGTSEEGVANGTGTIFSVDPQTGTEHDLYTFFLQIDHSPKDGFLPTSGLTRLGEKLYGTTAEGNGTQTTNGSYQGYGTVFVFDPATNIETPLHDFSGLDGGQPSLFHDPLVTYDNALYGTAYFNGPHDHGAIYRITASGRFSLIYGFPNNASGCNPTGILITAGTLYGTTAACGKKGGGNVYALDLATRKQKVLYSFDSGSVPLGKLLAFNGALLGVTKSAGVDHAGSVYKIDLSSGTYTLLHTFTAAGNDGDQPSAGLTIHRGMIYGVTSFGPGQDYTGTIFTINPSTGTQATVGTFTQDTGYAPFGSLLSYDGALYGTTVDYLLESSVQQGSIFKFVP